MSNDKKKSFPIIRAVLTADFVVSEVVGYLTPLLTLILVTAIMSGGFASESAFAEFVNSKIAALQPKEFAVTLGAGLGPFALAALIKELAPSEPSNLIVRATMDELPRTFYVFGGALTSVLFSTAIFAALHPELRSKQDAKFAAAGAFFGVAFFLYGFGLKLFFTCRREMARRAIAASPTAEHTAHAKHEA